MSKPQGSADKPARQYEDSMTEKQIAGAVRFGRPVTFNVLDWDPITGYVGGMDRFSYLVLVPNGDIRPYDLYLVHKGSTPLIELHNESLFESLDPDIKSEMNKIIRPFRNRIMSEFFPEVPRGSASSEED